MDDPNEMVDIDTWAKDAKAQIDAFVADYKANAAKGDEPLPNAPNETYKTMFPLALPYGEWDEQARCFGIV